MTRSVILISNGFQPDYEAGFANGLAANGVEVTLISSDRTLLERLDSRVQVKNLRGNQDPKRSRVSKALNLIAYFLRLCLFLSRQGTTVHLTGLFSLSHIRKSWADRSWKYECRIIRWLAPRLVLTVHNVVPHERDTPDVRRELASVYALPELLVVHTARARQRLIDEFDVAPSRICVMEHGVDDIVVLAESRRAAARAALLQPGQDTLALFFGAVQYYKGIDLLVAEGTALRAGLKLHIAGRCGDDTYRQMIDTMISGHPRTGQITWEEGYLSETRASELLAAADVVVMPYRHIDQSGVLFAALRHGTKVLAFDVGSLRDYLGEERGGVVPSGDTSAFMAALNGLRATGSAERERVTDYARGFAWCNTVRALLPHYGRAG
jgi:glycosyltransferase involved in cell wall biosynthesis